ncbi:MAG: hypothetical protein HRT58_20690 [Crocinitomicaceae bacterium]|nr:hypothetical protein [Crocinitomicaceae bacterium]
MRNSLAKIKKRKSETVEDKFVKSKLISFDLDLLNTFHENLKDSSIS